MQSPGPYNVFAFSLKVVGENGTYVEIITQGGPPSLAAINIGSGNSNEAAPAEIFGLLANAGPSQYSSLYIYGPVDDTFTDRAGIVLLSAAHDDSSKAQGMLLYEDVTQLVTAALSWGNGYDGVTTIYLASLNAAPGIPGSSCVLWASNNAPVYTDSNGQGYFTGRYGQALLNQIVISPSAGYPLNSNATSATWIVQAGASYHVRGFMHCTMGSVAAAANVGLNGPTASYVSVNVQFLWPTPTISQPPVSQTVASVTGVTNSATITANDGFDVLIDGWITFTASGTFGVVVGEHTSGDQWTIDNGYLMIERAA